MALTHTCNGAPLGSLQTKGEAVWPQFMAGRPCRLVENLSAPPTFSFHVEIPHWMPKAVQGGPGSNSCPKHPGSLL